MKEIRSLNSTDAEVRATRRGRTIEGYAIVFNRESKDLGGFREVIKPEAIEGVLERSDVLALLNHDDSRGLLARSTNGQGTLELSVDTFGVKYRFDAPDTVLGDEVLSGVRRGDIRTSSFAFTVAENGQEWRKDPEDEETYLRTISKFDQIFDVSPVFREAYSDTTVAVRSLVEIRSNEKAAEMIADLGKEQRESPSIPTDVEAREDEKKPVEAEKKEEAKPSYAELEAYYRELEAKMSNLKKEK